MSSYYARFGDWRKLFTSLDDLNRVTPQEVQRVAQRYFVPVGRTLAYIVTVQNAPSGGAGGDQ